ncbi:MAG: SGNH/GDSL hydrolase family protein [Bacteroidota bacterium]|nr:SGNH/GDSL hydrolase family protein [Candidatus Kapabacteria bacterium]MDW8220759.1 SGNH/GDSL hydrolase family protein [Bacteroidota bacterium]
MVKVLQYLSTIALTAGLSIVYASCSGQEYGSTKRFQDSLSYLALGDSYTIAERLDIRHSWAIQIAGLVRAEGIPLKNPDILARTGWRTDQLLEALRSMLDTATTLPCQYDVVSLLIGVNNQYQGGTLERFRSEYVALLHIAITLTQGNPSRVLALSIPDYSVTPFAQNLNRQAIAQDIDRFNAVQREECSKLRVPFVDITSLSRAFVHQPFPWVSDGLHPSPEQYAAWARAALPTMLQALRP